ncbi:MAG: hypothetical protein PHE53_11330 [Thermoguttaceae bacterium]|nr:hypothetical protein [Thermoguttaceae bacterium]
MAEIDVYAQWLKITDPQRPVNYYTLLGVQKFEDDANLIRKNYRQRNTLVRKYATGVYSKRSQELLNELAKAMLCLTDAQRKGDYDVTLGRERRAGERRTLEQILLAQGKLASDQLNRARSFADATGLEMRDVLISQKMLPIEEVTQAYAESLGLPYMDLNDVLVDETLLLKVNVAMAREYTYVPILEDEGLLLVAAPAPLSPEIEDDLRLRFDMPVRMVLVAPNVIAELVTNCYSKEKLDAVRAAAGEDVVQEKKSTRVKVSSSSSGSMSSEDKSQRLKMIGLVAWMTILILFFVWYFFLKR